MVGCPRSGTTLLQSLISAHPLVFSFPESHFFPSILSKSRIYRIFGIASKGAGKNTAALFKALSKGHLLNHIPMKSRRVKTYTDSFVNILDRITLQNRKIIWLEKTPQHLHYIKPIKRYIKNAKFIHIVRNAEDVVASLYNVTQKYPQNWGGARTIDECIKRWLEDINITIRYVSHQNHMAVNYEKLVNKPKRVLQKVCSFIGIDYQKDMLKKYHSVANDLVYKDEIWKQDVKKSIRNKNGKKFITVFKPNERDYIKKQLRASQNQSFYQHLL